jgi:phospholipid transport system substrate-binding protein
MIRKLLNGLPALRSALLASLVATFGTFALVGPAVAERDEAAEAFVDSLASEAIEILGREDFTPLDREAAFRVLFTGSMDVKRIGIFALGQYARTPTPEEKSTYLALVEDFIVKVYASRLSDYTDQDFRVLSSQPKGRKGEEVIVSSQIEFATGRDAVPVEWWILKSEDGMKVFDVKVLGIWMAQEQRSAFISVIRNNRGNFSALLDHIETRIGEASEEIDSKLSETEEVNKADDS